MGDYVLESNPALERLIERLRAPEVPEVPELRDESLESIGDEKGGFRRRRSRFHSDHRRAQRRAAADVNSPAGESTGASLEAGDVLAEDAPVEDELWAVHEDMQQPDELLLVDFDEEPEIFDDDTTDLGNDVDEDDDDVDEPDEILDLYGEDDEVDEDDEDDRDALVGEVGEVGEVGDHVTIADEADQTLEEEGHQDVLLAEEDVNEIDEVGEVGVIDEVGEVGEVGVIDEIGEVAVIDEIDDVEDREDVNEVEDEVEDVHDLDEIEEPDDVLDVDDPLGELDQDRRDKVDWIIRAFEAWKRAEAEGGLEYDADHDLVPWAGVRWESAVRPESNVRSESDVSSEAEADTDANIEGPVAVDDEQVDHGSEADAAGERTDIAAEAVDEATARTGLIHEEFEPLEPSGSVPAPLAVQLSVHSGRKKARHKRQSPRQRKRSLRKAELAQQKARKAQRAPK